MRLRRQIDLHRQPTLENAAAILPVLQGEMGELDRQEKTLVACLLGKSLRGNLGWTGEELTQSLTLADQVERIVGRQPWAEVNRALLDIRVNCKYVSAAKAPARDDVRQEPLAPALYQQPESLLAHPNAMPDPG